MLLIGGMILAGFAAIYAHNRIALCAELPVFIAAARSRRYESHPALQRVIDCLDSCRIRID